MDTAKKNLKHLITGYELIEHLEDKYGMKISIERISPFLYQVKYVVRFRYMDYDLSESHSVKIRAKKGCVPLWDYKDILEENAQICNGKKKQCEDILTLVAEMSKMPCIKEITPYSHSLTERNNLSSLPFRIKFWGLVHSRQIKETVGAITVTVDHLTKDYIMEQYGKMAEQANAAMYEECFVHALKNNKKYNAILIMLNERCLQEKDVRLKMVESYLSHELALVDSNGLVYCWEFKERFAGFEEDLKNFFMNHIDKHIALHKELQKYVDIVNTCKNNMWKAADFRDNAFTLCLLNPGNGKVIEEIRIDFDCAKDTDIKESIRLKMLGLLECAENYDGISFF